MGKNQVKDKMMRVPALMRQLTFVVLVAFSSAGCVPVLIAAGAVGGYAVSRDTFEGVTAKSQDELWAASQKVLSIMGTVTENDRRQGVMYARVNGADVTLTLLPVNLTTTKLRIKARKAIFPRIGVAQDVYTKIINQLEG